MIYTKPELVALTHAVEAIQGTYKRQVFVETVVPLSWMSVGAYEADE